MFERLEINLIIRGERDHLSIGRNRRHCVAGSILGDPPHVGAVRVHEINSLVPIAAAAKYDLAAVSGQIGKSVVAEFTLSQIPGVRAISMDCPNVHDGVVWSEFRPNRERDQISAPRPTRGPNGRALWRAIYVALLRTIEAIDYQFHSIPRIHGHYLTCNELGAFGADRTK